jgi:hypothetical protein
VGVPDALVENSNVNVLVQEDAVVVAVSDHSLFELRASHEPSVPVKVEPAPPVDAVCVALTQYEFPIPGTVVPNQFGPNVFGPKSPTRDVVPFVLNVILATGLTGMIVVCSARQVVEAVGTNPAFSNPRNIPMRIRTPADVGMGTPSITEVG